jgi:CRISPR-associated protein Cas1
LAPHSNIKDAYREYLGLVLRPYSYGSFRARFFQWRKLPRKKGVDEELSDPNPTADEFVASEKYWRSRSLPKAKIIALRNGARLRVANGALEVTEHLPLHLAAGAEPQTVRFNEAEGRRGQRLATAMSMPKAIILPEHGWHITAEAVKFCLAHKIALVSVAARTSQGEKGLISVVAGSPQADAMLVRAQVRCNATAIAREIIRQKVETCASLGRLSAREARAFSNALDKARSVDRIVQVEAQAAAAYWNSRKCGIRTTSKRWPVYWATYSYRNSAIGRHGPRHADHPVNALLNWSYSVVAGRLSAELMARGACLAIGYLHGDQPGRYSLAYDALELLRPLTDEKVFQFVAESRFRRGDFLVAPSGKYKGEVRVSQELLKAFAPAVFISNDDISRAADWIVEVIVADR